MRLPRGIYYGRLLSTDRGARKVWLCQDSYIDKIAARFHLEYHKPAFTPLPSGELHPYEGEATIQHIHAYQQRIGSINFAAVITRPDIACAASRLATFLCNPSPTYLAAANQTISYLYRTRTYAIEYSAPTSGNE
jgi:hypothetical protein